MRNRQANMLSIKIAVAAAILLVIIGSAVYWMLSKPKFDKNTFCQNDKVKSATVVIIDRTGEFSKSHIRAIKDVMNSEIEMLKEGDMISLYSIDSRTYNGLSETLFEKCKPKSGQSVNKLIENERMIKNDFNKKFQEPIDHVLSNVINDKDSSSSPIIESLFDIVSSGQLKSGVNINRIVLLSDLLQHSKLITVYKGKLKAIDDDQNLKRIVPDLRGVDVKVFWILRDNREGELQSDYLLSWWEKLFEASHVSNISVQKVR
ncbi:hypothetical protein [Endozoicomonas sp. ALC013]|uniref:hypothetical protein n=2 Tax=unclassified Endozoicomonas TaxID=2644528 RepID=UPI003BB789FC